MTLLDIDPETFRRRFNREPFRIRHRLAGEPLLSLPALVELARALPGADIESNAGDLPIGLLPDAAPATGLDAEDIVRRIETAGAWMALKYVERRPTYRCLLERCLAEVRAHSDRLAPGARDVHGFIFVSSPRSVTPYHIDPEYNFLLQIQGEKRVTVWDPDDREAVDQPALERFLGGGHRNLAWRPELAGRGRVFDLGPGDGLHIPVTAPHWVQNGAEPSVSFSVTFRTPASEAREAVYKVNRLLRALRLRPRPVGDSAWIDALKRRAFDAARQAARLLPWRSAGTVAMP
jgi:hypothetical protein